jgi:hypothetical protein
MLDIVDRTKKLGAMGKPEDENEVTVEANTGRYDMQVIDARNAEVNKDTPPAADVSRARRAHDEEAKRQLKLDIVDRFDRRVRCARTSTVYTPRFPALFRARSGVWEARARVARNRVVYQYESGDPHESNVS